MVEVVDVNEKVTYKVNKRPEHSSKIKYNFKDFNIKQINSSFISRKANKIRSTDTALSFYLNADDDIMSCNILNDSIDNNIKDIRYSIPELTNMLNNSINVDNFNISLEDSNINNIVEERSVISPLKIYKKKKKSNIVKRVNTKHTFKKKSEVRLPYDLMTNVNNNQNTDPHMHIHRNNNQNIDLPTYIDINNTKVTDSHMYIKINNTHNTDPKLDSNMKKKPKNIRINNSFHILKEHTLIDKFDKLL
jgi:hypothetical protein